MSPGYQFVVGSKVKGQGHGSHNNCRHGCLHSCECCPLLVTVLVSVLLFRTSSLRKKEAKCQCQSAYESGYIA